MIQIGIIGIGQMGEQLVKVLKDCGSVVVYDSDLTKAQEVAERYKMTKVNSVEKILQQDFIFLAIHREGILEFFRTQYPQLTKSKICINLCSFLTRKEIETEIRSQKIEVKKNIFSCKIIGHFQKIGSGRTCFIIIDTYCDQQENKNKALKLLKCFGNVMLDREEKYNMINFKVAKKAMENVLNLTLEMKEENIDPAIVKTAIEQVYFGTTEQFPYEEKDYFLEMVCKKHKSIEKLNQKCLDYIKNI